jgi:hypothetical protein
MHDFVYFSFYRLLGLAPDKRNYFVRQLNLTFGKSLPFSEKKLFKFSGLLVLSNGNKKIFIGDPKMKIVVLRALMVFVIMTASFNIHSLKAADIPIFPIKGGLYLPEGIKCDEKYPVDSIFYIHREKDIHQDTFIIGADHYRCENVVINGNTYYISGKGEGGADKITDLGKFRWTIKIISQTSFSKDGKVYRYCRDHH